MLKIGIELAIYQGLLYRMSYQNTLYISCASVHSPNNSRTELTQETQTGRVQITFRVLWALQKAGEPSQNHANHIHKYINIQVIYIYIYEKYMNIYIYIDIDNLQIYIIYIYIYKSIYIYIYTYIYIYIQGPIGVLYWPAYSPGVPPLWCPSITELSW